MNKQYSGIHFQKTIDSGMAKVSVYNTTREEFVIEEELVDLYTSSENDPEDFVFWTKLPYSDDDYEVTVTHSGIHNPLASSPYSLNIVKYLIVESINDACLETVLTIFDDENNDNYTYTLEDDTRKELNIIKSFNGNGTITEFAIEESTKHAFEFIEFSINEGVTWFYPDDTQITWGSNSPDYNNETIDGDGHFTIKFIVAPDVGVSNVQIKYKPIFNKGILSTKLIQAVDDIGTYKDSSSAIRVLDYGLEFIEG